MSKEIGWVALPRPFPRTLPPETLLRCGPGSCTYRAIKEVRLNVDRYWSDWGTAAYSKIFENEWLGDLDKATVRLPPGYRFEGSEVVKEEEKPAPAYCTFEQAWASRQNQAEQQRGSGIESPLARAIREQVAQIEAYTARAYQQQIYTQQGGLGLSDYVFRQGDYQQQAVQSKNPACECGSTENVRQIGLRACKTSGLLRREHRCGACEQSRRRAELQAQKLEQTKRDMSRPVKRDPYEWLGFSSADWEE